MVTLAEEEVIETTTDKAEAAARNVIAGHPQGAVRRIVLYTVIGVSFAACLLGATPFALVGLAATVLLSSTDQLA